MPRGGQLWAPAKESLWLLGTGHSKAGSGPACGQGRRRTPLLPATLRPPLSSELPAEQTQWARTMDDCSGTAQLDGRVGWGWAGPLERVP